MERRAVIDVGTNSVKLLVCDVSGTEIRPVLEAAHQTRLGAGFFTSGEIDTNAIAATVTAVRQYCECAGILGCSKLRILCTGVGRISRGAARLAELVRSATGVELEIVSAAEEALLAYGGVATSPFWAGRKLCVFDVGGGSTELVIGSGTTPEAWSSIEIGAVKLLAECAMASDPPGLDAMSQLVELVRTRLRAGAGAVLAELNRAPKPIVVGTGGTPTILACIQQRLPRIERELVEGFLLSRNDVRGWLERLWTTPLSQRRRITGLPEDRADVILYGVLIIDVILDLLNADGFHVSTRGFRFGAIGDPKP